MLVTSLVAVVVVWAHAHRTSEQTVSSPVRRGSSVIAGGAITNHTKPSTTKSSPSGSTSTPSSSAPSAETNASNIIWKEDFTAYGAATPKSSAWNIADGNTPIYNDEQQTYSSASSAVRVESGALILEARQAGSGYSSGRIDTRGKRTVQSGTRTEARIRLPKGRGVWPAFWLLSDNQPHTTKLRPTAGDWAQERFYMWDGELDIMEMYGAYPGQVEATVHTFANSYEKQTTLPDPDDWHTYWMEWRGDSLTIGVDQTAYLTYAKAGKNTDAWPMTSDNNYYVILNLAMGGSGGGQIISAAGDRWHMQVAYVANVRL